MSRSRKIAPAFLAMLLGIALLGSATVSAAVIEGNPAGLSVSRAVSPAVGKNSALQVECRIEGNPSATAEPADIVLVLDTSGSMLKKTKAQKMQDAAAEFVNSILVAGSPCRVCLVSFALRAKQITGFKDASGRQDLVFEIDHLGFGNGNYDGTNIQDGIHLAQLLLNAQGGNARKMIVLLSDGYPNVSFKGLSSANFGGFTPVSGAERHTFRLTSFDYKTLVTSDCLYKLYGKKYRAGDATVGDHGIAVLSEAYFAKSAGTALYTIGFDVSGDAAARYVLLNSADSPGHFYMAGVQELAAAFGRVSAGITVSAGCVVQDAVPKGYELDTSKGDPKVFDAADYTATCGAAYYDDEKRTVRWVMGNLSGAAANRLHYTILKKEEPAQSGGQSPTKKSGTISGTKPAFVKLGIGTIANPATGELFLVPNDFWGIASALLLAIAVKTGKIKKKTPKK